MLERDVEKHFVKMVKAVGGEVRKVKWIGRNGAPDRRVMLPSWPPFWIEFKRPGEKPDDHQYREHARMRALGETVRIFDTIEQIDKFFHLAMPL